MSYGGTVTAAFMGATVSDTSIARRWRTSGGLLVDGPMRSVDDAGRQPGAASEQAEPSAAALRGGVSWPGGSGG